jgi:flagellar biogenesis protein FliO
MKRSLGVFFIFCLQLVCAATENVTTNALYTPLYNSGAIVSSTIKSMLIVVVLIAFWIYWNKVILPRLNGGVVQNRNMQLIEKLQVDPTTAVYLVKIGTTFETFVSSNRQITRLTSVPAKTVNLKRTVVPSVDFSSLLKQLKKSKLKK